MADKLTQGALANWRAKYPKLFEMCETGQDAASDPWEVALAGTDGRDKELLATLRQRLDDSGGAVRLELGAAGARLDIDPAWATAHGEAVVDITSLVYGPGAEAVRRWLLPGGGK